MGKRTEATRVRVVQGEYLPPAGLNAGEYYGPVSTPTYYDGRPTVWFKLPIADDPGVSEAARPMRCVVSPPHVFTEQPDGSLTITASILCHGWEGEPHVWHGFLTKGEWTEA